MQFNAIFIVTSSNMITTTKSSKKSRSRKKMMEVIIVNVDWNHEYLPPKWYVLVLNLYTTNT